MPEINKHIGKVDIGNYYCNKVLWLRYDSDNYNKYGIEFCVPELPDKFNTDKDLPSFKCKDGINTFWVFRVNGGMRYKSYYKIHINLDNIEDFLSILNEMKINPIQGIFTFRITKSIDEIINEIRLSVL